LLSGTGSAGRGPSSWSTLIGARASATRTSRACSRRRSPAYRGCGLLVRGNRRRGAAVPAHGGRDRFSSLIWNTCIMNGTASYSSNQAPTASSSTDGANGRNDSRRLILALRIAFKARRGSQTSAAVPAVHPRRRLGPPADGLPAHQSSLGAPDRGFPRPAHGAQHVLQRKRAHGLHTGGSARLLPTHQHGPSRFGRRRLIAQKRSAT
jgi:hypothetical protein